MISPVLNSGKDLVVLLCFVPENLVCLCPPTLLPECVVASPTPTCTPPPAPQKVGIPWRNPADAAFLE